MKIIKISSLSLSYSKDKKGTFGARYIFLPACSRLLIYYSLIAVSYGLTASLSANLYCTQNVLN